MARNAGTSATPQPKQRPGSDAGKSSSIKRAVRTTRPTSARTRASATRQPSERASGTPARPRKPASARLTKPAAARPKQARPEQAKPKTARQRHKTPRLFRMADSRKRLRVLLAGLCVLMSLFAGRLVQLQGLDASTYMLTASQIGRKMVPLPAERGDIVDRNGEPLARAVEAYNVFVDQTQVTNPAAYALQLETVLDQDAEALQERLTGEDRFVYVAKDVGGSTWREIQDMGLSGLDAENADARAYPAGPVAGNVVGFLSSDGTPLGGLELSQENTLAGQDGRIAYRESPSGERIPTDAMAREEPVPGESLELTIDRDLQWYAEEVLAEAVDNANADGGTAVVLELTGEANEIAAIASAPSLDPNHPEKTDGPDRGSRAVEEAYEPGSVFKPLTMAAILEEGVADASTTLPVADNIRRSGHTIRDHYGHPEQEMTLAGILAKSSNVGTLQVAEELDGETFRGYLERFGIGEATGIGLPSETSGRLPSLDEWSQLTQDNISFGQGVSVNTVQMASAYATIANGGVRIDPTLVSATVSADGERTPTDPREPDRVVSEETAAEVTAMMEAVMGEGGTGQKVALDGYRVAGKTGTAQRVDPECGCYSQYNASFMGFAPADDPQYVVAVSLMNPRNGNSGSGLAGPAFADILQFALERDGVAPSEEPAPELPLFADGVEE
ncbi:penicillin-binding transpeptidase domain-containing protein [Phytoactinopolyspora halotolerans]|uniref:Penicillin-binding protein 2 n=1 Tax=Phytoactinopolyspora halotolerans TaxID=1981512 RepID=A0A6L9SDA8_9ACTN|nr:penicillin-binding protein 2 [Phytoactinopolyspora halotolerans]NEE03087.1 penicillin-binding protein 2 [Phytoactinopolyspora halotolerans]